MTRAEANKVCVGDEVMTSHNEKFIVVDLMFIEDSNGGSAIGAKLKNQYHTFYTNLENCDLVETQEL